MNLDDASAQTEVGPHDFVALFWIDGWRRYGRCMHCYLPRDGHPVRSWVRARWVGDRSRHG